METGAAFRMLFDRALENWRLAPDRPLYELDHRVQSLWLLSDAAEVLFEATNGPDGITLADLNRMTELSKRALFDLLDDRRNSKVPRASTKRTRSKVNSRPVHPAWIERALRK